MWHGIDPRKHIARELGWWTAHPDDVGGQVEDYARVGEAIARGYLTWDRRAQRYRKARSIGAANLTAVDLAAALRAGVAGRLADEAAVELVLEEGTLLDRATFRRVYVDYQTDPNVTGGLPMARIKWKEAVAALDAGQLPASSGAADRVLRIAASLGGGVPVNLRENATNSLGRAHAGMVAKAMVRATGIVDAVMPSAPPGR